MKASRADAFRLAADGDGVAIEFGQRDTGAATLTITLTDRVVLDRETARRLLHGLREALARRAPTLADAEAGAADDSFTGPTGAGAVPLNLPPDRAAEASARLLERIRELGAPFQHERSFRLSPSGLQGNRFLASLNVADLGPQAVDRALAITRELGMPADAQVDAREHFGTAHCLHFGYEAAAAGVLCKLYLERQVPADEAARAAADGASVPLHLAYKWDMDSSGHVVTRYDWFPGLTAQAIAARLQALYARAADVEAAGIAIDALSLAAARTTSLQYLEVHEPDNGRHSFDLNLYDANLTVRDLLPMLLIMRDLYGIRPGQMQALVDQVRTRALGHLAGGVHRDGRGFFNVYYGVTGYPRFAARLG